MGLHREPTPEALSPESPGAGPYCTSATSPTFSLICRATRPLGTAVPTQLLQTWGFVTNFLIYAYLVTNLEAQCQQDAKYRASQLGQRESEGVMAYTLGIDQQHQTTRPI